MLVVVNCSKCATPLWLPPTAEYFRCANCQAVIRISSSNTAPPMSRWPASAPSPYNHGPRGPPPNVHGQKKAVIIGILYEGTEGELEGSINDAKSMRYLLIKKFKFPKSSILMLTDEESDPCRIPTGRNIRLAMRWLVQGCQPGDSLVFHFSGHGDSQRSRRGEELDGYDETLVPVDHEEKGVIVDNEINATLVRPITPGVNLHAIIDACHSGTVLDLPYLCKMNRRGNYEWEDHRPLTGAWKGSSGGEVISFSGCDDHQTSADTAALVEETPIGAMTFSFIQAIEEGYGVTYGSLLAGMKSIIRKDEKLSGWKQDPQLTANKMFDVYSKPFSL